MIDFPKNIHPRHKIISTGTKGRTFICGDLHGSYDQLIAEMELAKFQGGSDKILFLGDITDRGIKSYECLKLLKEPWCTSILGNHDEIMLNSVHSRTDRHYWRANGGGWFDELSYPQQEEVRYLCERYVEHIPISITLLLPDGATIGLLHAEPPSDWYDAVTGSQPHMEALWGRIRIRNAVQTTVSNVDLVLVGHTSNNNIVQLGNVVYLDTGAGFKNGNLTMLELGTSLDELKRNIRHKIAAIQKATRPNIVFEAQGNYRTD